jgi:hypothetical protein
MHILSIQSEMGTPLEHGSSFNCKYAVLLLLSVYGAGSLNLTRVLYIKS